MKINIKFTFFMLIIGFLSVTLSCESDDDTKSRKQNKQTNNSQNSGGLVIAYYSQDSIATAFNFFREVDSMLQVKEKEYQKNLQSKYENYQRYEADVRRRMDAGEITGYQLEDVQREAMQKQEAIANFERQRGAELQQESFKYQNALMNKISEAGREFSEKNGIDMLFFYQKGGQITYISDAFDVTDDFIHFLNKREEEIISGVEEEVEEADSDGEDSGGLNF